MSRSSVASWLATLAVVAATVACRTPPPRAPTPDGRVLLERVAAAWNAGDARAAAACFAEDALYEEPPAKQLYRGRAALFEFFGGDAKLPMKMRLHHVAYDAATQTGFGEYTFELNHRYHGIVIIHVRDGLITQWREYQYPSELPYDEFARNTRF